MRRSKVILMLTGGAFVLAPWVGVARAEINIISGKVIFKGDPAKYRRRVINTGKDPNCAKAVKKIGTEKVVINKKTTPPTLKNVLVSIKEGLEERIFPTPSEPVSLMQSGCHYKPHVLGVVEGQPLKILNGDNTNHNIHFLPKVNQAYNFTQPKKDTEKGKQIKLFAEKVFKVKCDVHPWMGCYVAVFKHPFFSVTGKDGTYELKGMPAGKYTLEAWHESFGRMTAEVTAVEGQTVTQDFVFEPDQK